MTDEIRYLVLADGHFGPSTSKTANACIRYAPQKVAAVIDSRTAGRTASSVLGFGGDIPIVATFKDGLAHSPTALLIGIAPQGGRLPEAWRETIRGAIAHGLDVWSGLHAFLGDDPELGPLARARGVVMHDLRKSPSDIPVAPGRAAREVNSTIILTVGTDCSVGKMTAQLQLKGALRDAGERVAFVPTGQTGILVEGWGISVDAVVADFIAGAAERLVLEAAQRAELLLVEGQGSIVHPGYSGVTYGLMHGSLPHAMIMCTKPTRTHVMNNPWMAIPPLPELIALHERAMSPLRPSKVIGISLNTFDMSDEAARKAVESASNETGLPAADPVRYDPSPLVNAITSFHRARTMHGAAL
jgi:uncharacterized NAD-dependent epimerase/dehydratase family protein